MFEIDGKIFRNIQEQVQKNKSDIAAIRNIETVLNEFGVRVLGKVDTESEIPEGTYEYGDAYLVGTEEPYDMYVFTRDDADGHFIDIGPLNIVGPQGPKGDTGDKGDTGNTGATGATGNGIYTITKTGTSGLVDTYTVSYTDGTSTTFTVTNGANGQNGADGDPGESFMIMGVISSTSLLPDPSTTPRNHAYVYNDGDISTADRIYYITGAVGSEVWSYSSFAAAGTTVYVNGNPVSTFDADTKQNALVSGTSIKTINNQNLLGSGDINTTVKKLPESDFGYYVIGNNVVSEDIYNLVKTSQYANLYVAIDAAGTLWEFIHQGSKNNASYISYNWIQYTDHDELVKWVLSPLISNNNKVLSLAKYTFSMQKALPTTSTAGQVLTSTSTAGTVQWETLPDIAYSYTNVSFATKAEFSTFMKNNFRQIHSISFKPTNALNVAIGAIQVGDSNGVKTGAATVTALQWDLIPNDKATTLILESWVDAATPGEYTFRWVFAPIAWGSSVRVEHSSGSGTMTASGLICNGSVSSQYIGGIAQRQEIQNYLLNTTITVKHLGALTI